MQTIPYWGWAIVGVLLVAGEAFTPVMFLLPFGVAALGVAVLAFLGVESLAAQLWAFAGASTALTVLAQVWLRPLLSQKKHPGALSGTDRLTGCVGVITQAITRENPLGRCRVENEDWSCATLDPGDHLGPGARVVIKRVEGVKLIVEKSI